MSKFSNFLERLGIKTNNSVQLPNAGSQRKHLYTGVSREVAIARLDKARSI